MIGHKVFIFGRILDIKALLYTDCIISLTVSTFYLKFCRQLFFLQWAAMEHILDLELDYQKMQ